MSKQTLGQCRTGADLVRVATRQGAEVVRQTGSHVILKHQGRVLEPIPCHAQELGRGLLCKLIKMLAGLGFTVLVLACLYFSLLA